MILDKFKLDGKVALVTGSRRGLGQAMALGLAEAGADIVSVDRNDPDDTRAKVEALGRRHRWQELDLLAAAPEDFSTAIDEIVAAWGQVDILVNNAGVIHRERILEYSVEGWQDVIQVNLNAVWYLSQAAARQMAEQGGGKIIHVASVLAHQGGMTVPAYSTSKHAILGLARAMSNELAAQNINVNAISPGYMRTDLTDPLVGNPAIEGRIPAARWGQPEDLQGAVVLLASEAGSYMHGVDVIVDGGWLGR